MRIRNVIGKTTLEIRDRVKKAKTLEEIITYPRGNQIPSEKKNNSLTKSEEIKDEMMQLGVKVENYILNKENDKLKDFLNKRIFEELKESHDTFLDIEKQRNSTPNTFNLHFWDNQLPETGESSAENFSSDKLVISRKTKNNSFEKKKNKIKTEYFSDKNMILSKAQKNDSIFEIRNDNTIRVNTFSNHLEILSFFKLLTDQNNQVKSEKSTKKQSIFTLGKKTQDIKSEKVINYSDLNKIPPKITNNNLVGETIFETHNSAQEMRNNEQKNNYNSKRKILKNIDKITDSLEDEEEVMIGEMNNNSDCIIIPDSKFKITWDILLAIIRIYSVITTPLVIAFEELNFFIINILDLIFEVIFIFDIVLSFFTGYYNRENDELVTNNTRVANKYFKGWFFIDLISSVPSNCIYTLIKYFDSNAYVGRVHQLANLSRIARIMKLFRLLKFLKVINSGNKIDKINLIEELNLSSSIKRFLEFALEFFIFSHILSCIFIFLAGLDAENWITKSELQNSTTKDVYVASIYFIWTTIFTIGYGDIVSVNMYERIFNILVMMIGVLVYSYTVSSLGNMVTTYDKITKRYLNNLDILEDISRKYPKVNENYIEDAKVSLNKTKDEDTKNKETLYEKLAKFLNYEYKMNKYERMKFINDLPMKIRNELIFNMYKKVIDNFIFFRYSYQEGRNEAFNSNIILKMRPLKVYLNEYVIRDGDTLHEMIFVKNGVLSIELPRQYFNYPILALRNNDHYGVVSVLNGERSEVNLRVKSKFAELFIIHKNDLVQISVEHPEIFNEILKNSSQTYFRMKEIIQRKKEKVDAEKLSLEEKNKIKLNQSKQKENKKLTSSPNKKLKNEPELVAVKSTHGTFYVNNSNYEKKKVNTNQVILVETSLSPKIIEGPLFFPGEIKSERKSPVKSDKSFKKSKSVKVRKYKEFKNEDHSKTYLVSDNLRRVDDPDFFNYIKRVSKVFRNKSDKLINPIDESLTKDVIEKSNFIKNQTNQSKDFSSTIIEIINKKASNTKLSFPSIQFPNQNCFKVNNGKDFKNSQKSIGLEISNDKLNDSNKMLYNPNLNNLKELENLQSRYKSQYSECKNAFISSVRKAVESKLNEEISFERNPQGFFWNNFKEIFKNQIKIQKEPFIKVNDKLDDLYFYLTRNVDKSVIKKYN